MKVIIQKPDLDTCLTALIMGVTEADEIIVSKGDASKEDIMNPDMLCIEVGGSSLVHLNNFDHHNTTQKLHPACMQAYEFKRLNDEKLNKLVEYVCMVDERQKYHPVIKFPSLSNIFSGMLLVERNPTLQFLKGIDILNKVLSENIDPYNTLPDIEDWRPYRNAKDENIEKIAEVLKKAEFYTANNGFKIGFVESYSIGGIGILYAQGCDVVIMYNPAFGEPPVTKYTIAGNSKKVNHLVKHFDKIEAGWGGRETIIGSPRVGTKLKKEEVLAVVLNNL